MEAIVTYIKERFPVLPALLFAVGYFSLGFGAILKENAWKSNSILSLKLILLGSAVFFFFLLRQRVIDEFRDAEHDRVHFPDRPLPRGLVSKQQLILLGSVALIAEWLAVILIGKQALIFYIPTFAYTMLMAKEFFISKLLSQHFTIYFLAHEVVFLFYSAFMISIFNGNHVMNIHQILPTILVLSVAPISIELIRKFKPRYNKKGKLVKDTYSAVWGRRVVLTLLILIALIVGILLSFQKRNVMFLLFSAGITIAWLSIGGKSDKAVVVIGAINLLGAALLANVIW